MSGGEKPRSVGEQVPLPPGRALTRTAGGTVTRVGAVPGRKYSRRSDGPQRAECFQIRREKITASLRGTGPRTVEHSPRSERSAGRPSV